MPLPIDFNTGHVHAEYVRIDGSPVTGDRSVTFTVQNAARFIDPPESPAIYGVIIISTPITIPLDNSSGTDTIDVDLPATNDPDISPTIFTYLVSENFQGGSRYVIELPAEETVDLSAIVV